MKSKRIFAALAAAVMLCTVTGCSSGNTSADTSTRMMVSKTKNGRPESPGVLRGSSTLNASKTSNDSEDTSQT